MTSLSLGLMFKRPRAWLVGLFKKFWWLKPLLLVAVACLVAMIILRPGAKTEKKNYEIVECSGQQAQNFKCWEKRYQGMVMLQSPKAALEDVKQEYAKQGYVYSQCHQILHVIGRSAGEKYGDVSKAYDEGDNICWSGYYHGVMEAIALKMGPTKVLSSLNTICDTVKKGKPYSFYHFNCVHGLGHGVMAIEDDELFKALNDCDKFTDIWERESCYGGVFMENVMSSINPDHKTSYIKADDPLYPCTAVDKQFKHQCYLMQTSHALTVVGNDYAKVFQLCGTIEPENWESCYQSLGRDASGSSISNTQITRDRCMLGPNEVAQENCFVGAVKDFISYFHDDKQGLELCKSITDTRIAYVCEQTATIYYSSF